MPSPWNRRITPLPALLAVLSCCLVGTAQAQRACRVAEVTVSPPDAQFQVGVEYPFMATAYNAAGEPCDANIRWISSNPAVATISTAGIALGIGAGTATITARVGAGTAARSGTAAITVSAGNAAAAASARGAVPGYNPRPNRPQSRGWAAADRQPDGTGSAENIIVEPLQLVLVRGESRYLDFHAVRADGSAAAPVPLEFAVDPGGENIIAADTFGLVTSRGEAGAATVRISIPGQVRIQPKLVRIEVRADTVRFNRPTLSLVPGAVDTLSIFIPAQSRALNPGGLFQFVSTDTTKLRVNPAQPIIEARAPGTARIIAQSGLYSDIAATVNVHRRVSAVRLEPADSVRTIAIGGTTQLRAAALDASGQSVLEAPLTWRAPDSAVASFDPATGQVVGRRTGEALITVFAPGGRDSALSRSVRVRVVAGGLALARTRLGLTVGERAPLDVQILDEQRRAVMSANQYLTWSSSADSVARIEGNEVLALNPGRARLTGRAPWDSSVVVDLVVGGELVAVNQRGGRYDLAAFWAGGANWKPLSADSLVESQPAWSPDLTRLAYIGTLPFTTSGNRGAVTRAGLWMMNADGSEPVRLTDDSTQTRSPGWAGPNRIVFEWNKGGMPQIWLYELPAAGAGSGATRPITTTAVPNMAPAVSPDGERIVYVSSRQSSPGRSAYGLYTAALDGSDERLVITAPQGQRLDDPSFTPDGRGLMFLRSESGRQPGQRVYRIALSPAPGDSALPVTPPTLFVRSFASSADGSVLALSILEQAPNNRQVARVVLFTVATGATAALGVPEDELSSATPRPAPRPVAAPAAPGR